MRAIFRLWCFCLLLGMSSAAFAQTCEGPLVKFGEVRAGFQAGFVAGRLIDTIPDEATGEPEPLADGFWRGHAGYDQRGFIDVESNSGWLCEGDWALVSSWFALPEPALTNLGLTPAELRMLANSFLQTRIIVDGVEDEPVELRAKPGTIFPYFLVEPLDTYVKAWGRFFEPGSLAVGTHDAVILWRADYNCLPETANSCANHDCSGPCDGDYETFWGFGVYEFQVIANP